MKCVCSGCMPCYIGVYQCGLWSIVQVCLCGDWRLSETFLILRITKRDMIKISFIGLHVKYPLLFSDFNGT